MEMQGDLAVKELANLYPRIRSNIRFTFQIIKNVPSYIVEDPVNSRYYRIGVVEYKFISLLNGRKSVMDAMRMIADSLGEDALEHQEVVQILHWLGSVNLLHTNKQDSENEQEGLFGVSAGVSKIMFPRFPFGNPDKALSYVLPLFRPLLGIGFFLVWLVVVLLSAYLVFSQWPKFIHTANSVLVPQNWLHLMIVWVLLKVIHELWHGLVCKYHGAEVRETGILFILFLPLGFVDTSASWNIPSKWKRIHIALAGMKIELLIAAISGIIWSETSPGALNQICYEIIIMAGITTVFFNANPLMRFDGYYVLTDFLEEVNLYSRAGNYIKYLGKKYILGVKCSFVEESWSAKFLLFLYGISAFIWRILIFTGIAIGASFLFLGVGLALAVIYAFTFLVVPPLKLFVYMFVGTKTERPPLLRSCALLALFVYAIYASFYYITWQKSHQASGVVKYRDFQVERVYCPGFVNKIYVKTGDYVKKGKILFKLRNFEVMAEQKQLKIDIEQTKAKIRYYEQNDIVAAKIEEEKLIYFKRRWKQQKKLINSLTIRASINGYVSSRNLQYLKNTFMPIGEDLVTIFDPKNVQLLVAIPQEKIEQYQILLREHDLNIYIPSLEKTFKGKLENITPQATRTIPHPALCVIGGGDILVQKSSSSEENYQLVIPHFVAEISLPQKNSKDFKFGQRGYVRIYQEKETLGKIVYYEIENWLREIWKIRNAN